MPKAFPKEFREDVIRVYKDSDASMAHVAKDFGAVVPEALARDRREELEPVVWFTPVGQRVRRAA